MAKIKISIELDGDCIYFKGSTVGVRLSKRGQNDNHVVVDFVIEDDGDWFISNGSGFSSYFIEEHMVAMKAAIVYMRVNCKEGSCGWEFKE